MTLTIKEIRRAGVPLCAIESADPAATVKGVLDTLSAGGKDLPPLVSWDICGGLVGLNPAGKAAVAWYDPLAHPLPEILKNLAGNPVPGLLAVFHNIGRYWDRDGVAQGVWNLRDVFKGCGATALFVGQTGKLPGELSSDVVTITEPSPGPDELTAITDRILKAAGEAGAKIREANKGAVVSALRGLPSAFDAEQTLSLSISRSGVDVSACWERKIKRLRGLTGAEITIDNPRFDSLAGCENVKAELSAFIGGRQKPGVTLFLDEIEKLFAGAGTDLSGVSTNLVGMFLSWTADRKAKGFLLPGVPGAGKTWTATCAAGEAGVPLFKLADIKGSLVGESEAKLRAALQAVDALAGDGAVMMIASCNWVDTLAPDILARFSMGQFFYDFPSADERKSLWRMYMKKLGLPKQEVPASDGWVGREIESACWRAWQYNRPLVDVARNVCPAAVAQKAKLDDLRRRCSGRFLSASKPGVYEFAEVAPPRPGTATADRALSFED